MSKKPSLLYSLFFLVLLVLCSSRALAIGPEMAFSFDSISELKGSDRPPVVRTLRMWRSEREVETYEVGSKDGQAWLKDVANEVSYVRILHPERVQVDFLVGDLKATANRPDWVRVSCVVSPEFLKSNFQEIQHQDINGLKVRTFKAEIAGQHWTVLWSDELQLAVQVRVEDERAARTITLKERHPLEFSPIQRMKRGDYESIEFTELGDHDTDKRFVRIMQRIGMSCGHGNCGAACVLP